VEQDSHTDLHQSEMSDPDLMKKWDHGIGWRGAGGLSSLILSFTHIPHIFFAEYETNPMV
jgi:hypothetical protein